MGTSNNRKHKNNTGDIVNMTIYLYLILILGLYPWYVDAEQHYFNITITKYKFFLISSLLFVLLAVFAYGIHYMVVKYNGNKGSIIFMENLPSYKKPEFWMGAFLLANVFACFVSFDKKASLSGENSRYMGLWIYIVFALVFFLLSNRNSICHFIFVLFAASTMYSYIIAIFQHMGNDFMGYKDRISAKQYDIFISTFGNINMFASFLAISVPVFICFFIFSEKLIYKIISIITIVAGGMCLMIANSDSGYLGVAASCIFIFLLSYYNGYVSRFILSLICLAFGNLGVVLLNKYVVIDYDKRGGVAQAMDRIDLAVLLVFILLVIYVIVRVLRVSCKKWLEGRNKKHVIIAILGVMFICGVVVVAYGIHKGISLFRFNYKWGTYRGYIWTKCVELYKAAPLQNKIFGYGNATLKSLMVSNYNSEMISVTGKTYDNAHNEVLQYLITTGIAGAVSYVGLFVSSFIYILKRASGNLVAYVSLAAIMGYFVQGLINLNQPITTPFFFVFMALGVGSVRGKMISEENSE